MNVWKEEKVKKLNNPTRLVDYALLIFKKEIPSRNGIKKAIIRGEIRINKTQSHTGTFIKEGDLISLYYPKTKSFREFYLQYDILFEDDYLAVINKPAGYPVSGNQFKTIANTLPHILYPSKNHDALSIPHPVHRLDSLTSGLLIIAKTRKAQISMGKQFEQKEVTKKYQAIVMGKMEKKGRINFPIDGKPAETIWECLKETPSLRSEYLSWLKLEIKTGRTHQIRIHLSQIGNPILGDKIYGKSGEIFKGKGLFLCANYLHFIHPVTKEILEFSIDPPTKFLIHWNREIDRWVKFNIKVDE